jgi:DNA-directed RNA polymerase subunit M
MHAMACDRCGYFEPMENPGPEAPGGPAAVAIKVVAGTAERMQTLPTTQAECPKCGNGEASWWFLQTRGGDEATTQFYRCTKCAHTWRHYA